MGQTREQKIIKQLSGGQIQKQTPIATDMFLPNHSGIKTHPEFKDALGDYVPYTGATADVDLGSHTLTQTLVGDYSTGYNIFLNDTRDFDAATFERQAVKFVINPTGTIGASVDTIYNLSAIFTEADIELMIIGETAENSISVTGGVFDSIGKSCPANSFMSVYGVVGVAYGELDPIGTGGYSEHIGIDGRASQTAKVNIGVRARATNGDLNYAFYSQYGDNFFGDDNVKSFFGSGNLSSIYSDGIDLIIQPQESGSGNVLIGATANMTIDAGAYKVGGTAGISATITTAKLTAGGANGSMTFVNGILTAQTQST